MSALHFPRINGEKKPAIKNVNELFDAQSTFGQRIADKVATRMGSWNFIIIQSSILVVWIILNITAYVMHWDPYPFILMNLVLSMQAAYTAPMIMMSQNRQAERDRVEAHNDYLINLKAEGEVRTILEHLDAQNKALADIHDLLLKTHGIKPEDEP